MALIPPKFCSLSCRGEAMKTCSCLVTLSLALAFVNAFTTEEHVKRFFRPEHRALLPETTSLEFRDEPALLTSSQNDESTKCLAHCEPSCEKLDIPAYLRVSNQKQTSYFMAIRETNCSLGYFNRFTEYFRLQNTWPRLPYEKRPYLVAPPSKLFIFVVVVFFRL